MRIRQVRPEFFSDPVVSALAADVRLTYIGLWCIADDAGWLRWDTANIGAVLYPYATPGKREKHVAHAYEALIEVGRIKTYDCGCVHIPTLAIHQKIGGNKSTTALDFHSRGHAWARRPDVRTQVMERDNYQCRYCGRTARDGVSIVLEHLVNGGPTTLDNCVTACQGCNVKKGTKTYQEAGLTLRALPVRIVPDESGTSQTDPPGKERNGSNGNTRASANDEEQRKAFRRLGLPVDAA